MPLKCQEVYLFLQAYLDGEIGPDEERKLEAHVRLCPSCKKKLFSLQRLITSLESMEDARPAGDFTDRLLERFPEEVREKMKRPGGRAGIGRFLRWIRPGG